jgi:thioredoxin-like negative regulator of GroEL
MADVTPPPVQTEPIARPEIVGFPAWIKAFALAIACLLLFALMRVGPSVNSAIAAERAHKFALKGQYAEAARLLQPVVDRYPDAVDYRLDLAEAYANANNARGAIETLNPLEGTRVSDEIAQRADQIAAKIEQLLPADHQEDKD